MLLNLKTLRIFFPEDTRLKEHRELATARGVNAVVYIMAATVVSQVMTTMLKSEFVRLFVNHKNMVSSIVS